MKYACITGDVHHNLGNSVWEEREPEYAHKYAEILQNKGAKGTIFVTGKAARRSRNLIRKIGEMGNMEVGAHTYQAFKLAPTVLPAGNIPVQYNGKMWTIDLRQVHHYLSWAVWGSFYGPLSYQKWNISRTVQALNEAGIDPISWRTHGYDSDERTFEALDHHGFFVVSDVRADSFKLSRQTENLWQATVTGPTDEQVQDDEDNSGYRQETLEYIHTAAERDEPVLLQMHPQKQAVMNFEHLEDTVDAFIDADYEFVTISELVTKMTGVRPPPRITN